MIQVPQGSRGDDEGDVDDDEEHEPAQDQEMQGPGDLDAENRTDPPEPSRQGRRHAKARKQGQGGSEEHCDEVGDELQAVVVGPAAFRRPVEGQVLDCHREGVRDNVPVQRDQAHPLSGGEQEDEEHEPVCQPQSVDAEVPPAGEPDGVSPAGEADPVRQRDRVVFGGVKRVGRHRLLHPEPLFARGGVPRPVEPRMIREHRHAGPDDEDHEK